MEEVQLLLKALAQKWHTLLRLMSHCLEPRVPQPGLGAGAVGDGVQPCALERAGGTDFGDH